MTNPIEPIKWSYYIHWKRFFKLIFLLKFQFRHLQFVHMKHRHYVITLEKLLKICNVVMNELALSYVSPENNIAQYLKLFSTMFKYQVRYIQFLNMRYRYYMIT